MLRLPNLTLAASFLLYLAARHFDWNLAAFRTGSWYFNPFCWQFLFNFGGWFALGGSIEAKPWTGCAHCCGSAAVGAHVVLVEISGAIWMQVTVSIVGITMMTAVA